MSGPLAPLEDVGTRAWLQRSGGHLSAAERAYLLRGIFPMIRDGFRLRRVARAKGRDPALADFARPRTPMVEAAAQLLAEQGSPAMARHCHRTAFWTLTVLCQHTDLSAERLETTWVAALLHDLGLDRPPEKGDFSSAGVALLEALAAKHRWADRQLEDAAQAIAINLTSRADPARHGWVAWAMNVGGAGELGIWPHRAQLSRAKIRELEAAHPREGFRQVALERIGKEVERIPDGRFALFQPVYWLLMR